MNKDNSEELFPIVDEEGNVVGKATRGRCHDGSRLLHPVVHLHLFDPDGRLYLQRRPEWKDIQPGSGILLWAVMWIMENAWRTLCAGRRAKR